MNTGFEIGMGIVTGMLMVYVFLVVVGIVCKKLGAWCERKSVEQMTPEQRASRAAFKMAEYFRNHK
jgi:Na+-transporting methylmalonyl-CoA/oxaloacetate decarboxylase gamma subunit